MNPYEPLTPDPHAMSTETTPAGPPPETAPSRLTDDALAFPRLVGMVGVTLAGIGLFTIVLNVWYGPRLVGKSGGLMFVAVGALLALAHAFRDPDVQVRRLYGYLGGFGLPVLAVASAMFESFGFFPYGWAASLLGLFFLLAFLKHEDEPPVRRGALLALGVLAAAQVGLGLGGGVAARSFLANGYAPVLGLLGLLYACGFVSQTGGADGPARPAAVGVGLLGVAALLYGAIRPMASDEPFLVPNGVTLMALGLVYALVGLGLVSDAKVVVVARRELASYFSSPVAYLVLIGMTLLAVVNYWWFVNRLVRGDVGLEPIVSEYFFNIPAVFCLMFMVPAVTMRLFAEERRTGTYEVLMCAPVSETSVVAGKFAATWIFYLLLWVPWFLLLVGLRLETGKSFEYKPLVSFFLTLALTGAAFVSVGLFFSSLTKNQIVAAVLTFVAVLILTSLYWLSRFDVGPTWKAAMQRLAYLNLWSESLGGRLQVKDMILQASAAAFGLFLTVRVLEARKWS